MSITNMKETIDAMVLISLKRKTNFSIASLGVDLEDLIPPRIQYEETGKDIVAVVDDDERLQKILPHGRKTAKLNLFYTNKLKNEAIVHDFKKRFLKVFNRKFFGNFIDFSCDTAAAIEYFSHNKIDSIQSYEEFLRILKHQKEIEPTIATSAVDLVVIENLNVLSSEETKILLKESVRALRTRGKISSIVLLADEKYSKKPSSERFNSKLEFLPTENEIISFFVEAGFHGINFIWRADFPSYIVNGAEFRLFQIEAYTGRAGICIERGHAVMYVGPWKEVVDDDGHKLQRGVRSAVCEKTFLNLTSTPYKSQIIGISPYEMLPIEECSLFDCSVRPVRSPKITKGSQRINDKGDDTVDEQSFGGCC